MMQIIGLHSYSEMAIIRNVKKQKNPHIDENPM